MRKKILFCSLVCSLFTLLITLENKDSVVLEAKDSSNGYHIEEVIRDKFNKETVDPSWQLTNASLEHYYNALHCISPVSYGSGPYINGARLSENTRIEFTVYPQSYQAGANISFNIGMPNYTGVQTEPNVDCKIQLWDTQASFVDYQNNLVLPNPVTIDNLVPYNLNLYEATTDVAIVISQKANQITELYVELKRDGKIVSSGAATPFKLKLPRYTNGYCGFFWDGLEMDLTNFKVYNNDILTLDDSFQTNTITFGSQDASLGNIHVIGLNETNCYFASVNSVKMDTANASIKNTYKLEEQDNVSNPYEFSYTLKLNELNDNSFVGFGFGLEDDDVAIDSKNAIGFIKSDDSNVEVVAIRNGIVDRSNNYSLNLLKLGVGKYQDYLVSFDYNNNAYLKVNGLTYKFENIDYVGQFGVGLVELDSAKSSNFEMNEFKLMANTYRKYDSIDMSNDINGKKMSVDGFSDEPYINTQKYFLGPNVSLEEDWSTGETGVLFTGAGAYSGFGTRQKYSEFICEFDVEVLSRQDFQYFGLSFGRESVVDVLTQSSSSNKSFLFRCDNKGLSTAQCVWGSGWLLDSGLDSQECPINVYDVEHTKYHMMFVAKNRSLQVYFKDINAPDSEMGILRASASGINIDGYVSIVASNGASIQVTNYKMVNLSDECKEESNLTLRETFTNKNNVSEKIVLDGTSKVKDGTLVMNNSTISSTNPYLYEMIRFTTYDLENSLQIMFSQGKKLVIDAKNNQIIVNENGVKTYYDCSLANLKNIKGKRFEITILGNQIKVGYKGYYDPADKLSETLMSHTFATPLCKDNIMFNANGKVVLDDLYLFALDNSIRCETHDYDKDPDNAEIWEVKPDFDPSKVYDPNKETSNENKGCKGSVSGTLLILALALPLIIRKKED